MRLLVLGGTKFLGRGVVEAALARGHEVTLFNRGETNPELYPEAEKLRGDLLAGELGALRGGAWDAVVDMDPTTLPRAVRAYAPLLADAAGHLVFVSSISAYADPSRPIDEDAPLAEPADPVERDLELYSGLKVGNEQAVEAAFGAERTTIVRPGLIVGPHDPSDRFTYWVRRIAAGGRVLAPEPEQPVQVIDARDLGAWLVRVAEERRAGAFNATGPERPFPMREVLETMRNVAGSDAELVWVGGAPLLDAGVGPWIELPLWLPPEFRFLTDVDVSRAFAAGLRVRPLADTVRDTLAWDRARGGEPLREGVGLAPERERELLELA